jgi:hypothetical protein
MNKGFPNAMSFLNLWFAGPKTLVQKVKQANGVTVRRIPTKKQQTAKTEREDEEDKRIKEVAKQTISVISNVVSYRFIGEYFLILNNLTIIHRYIMKSNGFKKIFAY